MSHRVAWNKGFVGFRKGENANERNGVWKGDSVGYNALHAWVKRHLVKPHFCHDCNQPALDLANISGQYKRDLSDWEWLCRKCHMTKDGRLKALRKTQFSKGQQNWIGRKRDDSGRFMPWDGSTIFPR